MGGRKGKGSQDLSSGNGNEMNGVVDGMLRP